MMHLQKVGVIATRPLALVTGTGQDKASGCWWYRADVALTWPADLAIIQGLIQLGFSKPQFSPAGLNGGLFAIGTLMDVELNW